MITREEYKMGQEIERFPVCPPLTEEMIKEITAKVFVRSNPQKADVIFVFGSSYGEWKQIADLYKKHFAPIVYVAGGIEYKNGGGKLMSHAIRDSLISFGVHGDAVVADEKSRNTKEDAIFGREIFDQKGISFRRILFACKAPHSGRCLRTLQKIFPESELFPFVYNFVYNGAMITEKVSEVWWQSEFSRSYVYGEYLRIMSYSARGDI